VVEKGPAFKMQMESTIDAGSGQVKIRYTDEDGKEKVIEERLELPADLANGLILSLVKNISPKKVHVPGLTGAIASLLGKTPPDSQVWILGGEAPAFVKAESPLFPGGPTWRTELVRPIRPSGSTSSATKDSKNFQPAGRRERPASSMRAAKKEPRSGKK